ncbi:hypothetical protein IWQ61_001479 [Dispira simplex]|nr:hypothetical protein IWQ61_001479 [Dispira simplex]
MDCVRIGLINRWVNICVVSFVTALLLTVTSVDAAPHSDHKEKVTLYNNGTHDFQKTVIIISFDAFQVDFLKRGLTPHLASISKSGGFQPEFMTPSFPTNTFPNHRTIVTGLLPEAHGIVNNEFYDPAKDEFFVYKNHSASRDSSWWGGEPIWITAEKQGVKSGVFMWPGGGVIHDGLTPSYLVPFQDNVAPQTNIDKLLQWLDLPLENRPQLLASYMLDLDVAAHKHSPNSKEANDTLELLENAAQQLWDGLAERNLLDIVNVIYVSDHGMEEVTPDKVIMLDDLVNLDKFKLINGFPHADLVPKDPSETETIFQELKAQEDGQPWKVYRREDIPAQYQYSHNDRIAPIIAIIEHGWTFFTKERFIKAHPLTYYEGKSLGCHGYDNNEVSMRSIFLAYGPDFQPNSRSIWAKRSPNSEWLTSHSTDQDDVIHPPFQNTEVYNLLCRLLDLEGVPNNGTLTWDYRTAGDQPRRTDKGVHLVLE